MTDMATKPLTVTLTGNLQKYVEASAETMNSESAGPG
jgi:hypothetical protein